MSMESRAPLPEWATEEQPRCFHCGGPVAPCDAGWIDDDGNLDGSNGHQHAPVSLTDGSAES